MIVFLISTETCCPALIHDRATVGTIHHAGEHPYTEIPELTPHILHEFVEKIVIYAATDPHSKVNRRQQVDIYYKGIGILEISKVFDTRHK